MDSVRRFLLAEKFVAEQAITAVLVAVGAQGTLIFHGETHRARWNHHGLRSPEASSVFPHRRHRVNSGRHSVGDFFHVEERGPGAVVGYVDLEHAWDRVGARDDVVFEVEQAICAASERELECLQNRVQVA